LHTEPQRHRFGLLLGREAGPRRAFGDIAARELIRGFVQPFWKENRTPETVQARFLGRAGGKLKVWQRRASPKSERSSRRKYPFPSMS
jgi:hypothetical protein